MPRALACLLPLLALAGPALAQDVDKAKVRAAIVLPELNPRLQVESPAFERDKAGEPIDAGRFVAERKKKLTGQPADADVLLELLDFTKARVKDPAEVRRAAGDLVRLVHPLLQTKDPKQAYLISWYALVLEVAYDSWDVCPAREAWARRATELAPDDWRTWYGLGQVLTRQIAYVLLKGRGTPTDPAVPQAVTAGLARRDFPESQVREAEKLLDEARKCHDKAKELAPEEPACRGEYYLFRRFEVRLRNTLAAYWGRPAPHPQGDADPEVLAELRAAARARPDDFHWQASAARHHLHAAVARAGGAAGPGPLPLADAERAVVDECLGRLERIASAGSGAGAAHCRWVLAALSVSRIDHAAGARYAAEAVRLDPKHRDAAELLQVALLAQQKHKEAVDAAHAGCLADPAPHRYFLLALAYTGERQWGSAEKALRDGLKLDGDHFDCQLGLAAALLRRDDAALDEAARLIARVGSQLRPDSPRRFGFHHDLYDAFLRVLTDDPVLGMAKLERLRTIRPLRPDLRAALAALGR